VRALALAPGGKVIVGGAFTIFDNTNRNYITRLNPDGSHDLTFDPGIGANSAVSAVAALSDGRVVLGGNFTNVGGARFLRLARLQTNGAPDVNFSEATNFNATVLALSVHRSQTRRDRLVVGGGFSTPIRGVAQLRLDGSVDTSFSPGAGANNPVHTVLALPSGEVMIGGAFTTVGGVGNLAARVARLTADGVFDSDFSPVVITNGAIYALAMQPDGKVVIAGEFVLEGAPTYVNVARLNTDGSLDSTFNVGAAPNGQASGRIIIAGGFTAVGGDTRNYYARLLPNGALDTSFDPGSGANGIVYTVLLLPDGNVLLGGDFTFVSGTPRAGIARIHADDVDARLSGIEHLGTETWVSVLATPGVNYILETSTNLINWWPIATNNATGTSVILTDPNVSAYRSKFYRVRQAGF
jgi:uncharacterized delta-60 repeat protein